MNQQDYLKKHYIEKFLYTGGNHHIVAPMSKYHEAPTLHNHKVTNYRKALSLLINKNPDYPSHIETQQLMEEVWNKYDWIGSESKESDNNITSPNINALIEKEVNKRLQQSMENKIIINNNELNSSLIDDNANSQKFVDGEYNVTEQSELSLLLNYAKETTSCRPNLSTCNLAPTKVNESEFAELPQPPSITPQQERPSSPYINYSNSRKNYHSPSLNYNNNCGIRFDNDKEFSEDLKKRRLDSPSRFNNQIFSDYNDNDYEEHNEEEISSLQQGSFVTAKQRLTVENQKGRYLSQNQRDQRLINNNHLPGTLRKKFITKTNQFHKFISPLKNGEGNKDTIKYNRNKDSMKRTKPNPDVECDEEIDKRLKNVDPKMIEMIQNEIMEQSPNITWDDIAGLEHAKKTIQEAVTWPLLRPDIFTGLRSPPKGLLLFGPPGTGKTLIGKCIASESGSTFFSISSSSLTSKWVGDGEKMVRALFSVARVNQPAVVFVDEIDSLLTQRTDGEYEASRRIKTEFLVQFDGVKTASLEEDRILLVGATNRPQEIDEAARRRFRKRLYIPLPEHEGRFAIVKNLLSKQKHSLTDEQIHEICKKTEGYSGSDMDGLCREAALGPIRVIGDIRTISADDVRSINYSDFLDALTQVRASVSDRDLELYNKWNLEYGSLS
ncbi:unnamed protein product [Rhizophagus irregularis]|uniref:AAA+ ATPase domain-containing protein n=1 Tax=Rhizophagus irregularis TaxID=588596 RepID=A0A916EHD1_9GLOM|nr:unnamed protein product [Rhizophagus irregularis]CAB5167592.1 unnamed protein product [Rhizophagus irregularis]CAB5391577.1 unnamed protein product [Rhizophagus irregularis]